MLDMIVMNVAPVVAAVTALGAVTMVSLAVGILLDSIRS